MKKFVLIPIVLIVLLISSCDKSETVVEQEEIVELNKEDNDFIWQAMNYWYFWQEDVTNLADTKDDDLNDYYIFLNGFNEPNDLFESLKFSADDFSWFIPDVDAQLNQFRGVSVSYGLQMTRTVFGVDPSVSNGDVYIDVTYVVSGSPADIAGFKRGDLIYKVDGQVLNSANFQLLNDIIFAQEGSSATIGVGSLVDNAIVPRLETTINAIQITENPVHFSSIIEEGGKKIGYLVYNGFRGTFNGELNDAFASFKSGNIDELILDLRYNGGGSVLTSAYLASMIDGDKADGSTFARLKFNSKRDANNGFIYPFYDNVALFDKQTGDFTGNFVSTNRLSSINTLYVITSNSTASASEMIINGLTPSMDVIIVGLTTTGKNEGSNTLVDAPASGDFEAFENVNGRTSNIGIQPITFQIFNSLNQSDYAEGFDPDTDKIIDELDYSGSILPFGDTNEALLRKTLDVIAGSATKSALKKSTSQKVLSLKLKKRKFVDEMYILPQEKNIN